MAGDESYSIIVAYADDVVEIMRNWPEASAIDYETVDGYVFTERFPRPEWFVDQNKED